MVSAAPGTAHTPRAHITNMAAQGMYLILPFHNEAKLSIDDQNVSGISVLIRSWRTLHQKGTIWYILDGVTAWLARNTLAFTRGEMIQSARYVSSLVIRT